MRQDDQHGVVYAMRGGRWVKVGFTTNVEKRLSSTQLCVPFRLRLIMAIPGCRWDEDNLLRALAQYRTRGEWFKWCPTVEQVLAYVARRGFDGIDSTGQKFVEMLARA